MEPLPTDYNNLAFIQRLLSTLEQVNAHQGSGFAWPTGIGGSDEGPYAQTTRPPGGNEAAELLALFPKMEYDVGHSMRAKVEVNNQNNQNNQRRHLPPTFLFEQESEILRQQGSFYGGVSPSCINQPSLPQCISEQMPIQVPLPAAVPHRPQHKVKSIHGTESGDYEARVEHFRRKNREAQQRFRERRKANMQAAMARWETLANEIDELESENFVLQGRIGMLEKVLIVRDAFVDALLPYERPKEEDDEKSVDESCGINIGKDDELYSVAVKLNTPELYTLYLCRWQAELKHLFLWAKEDGYTEDWKTQIQDHFRKMSKIWSFNVELYGQNFPKVLLGLLPEAGSKHEPWKDVAKTLFDCLDIEAVKNLNECWKTYTSKLTVLDEDWKRQLENLLEAVSRYDQVGESIARLEECNNNRWKASVELGGNWLECLGDYNSALCNVDSLPFVPDWISITKFVIFLALERGLL